MEIISRILHLYSSLAVAFVILIVFLIARFYQLKAGQRSNFEYFSFAALLYVGAWVALFFDPGPQPLQTISDMFLILGGITLLLLSHSLFAIMTGGRK